MTTTMPKLNLSGLTDADAALVARCVATRGPNKGCVRVCKPDVDQADPDSGRAAYLWRMIVWQVSPVPAHQCMPVCADLDLPRVQGEGREARMAEAKRLDDLATLVCRTVPLWQHHGTLRWARAFGVR